MPDDVELLPEPPPAGRPSVNAQREKDETFGPKKPNTAVFPLWKGGHISFDPESSVSVFALLSLALLLVCCIVVALIGAFAGDAAWLSAIFTALGHAIVGVVGAIVGSSAGSAKKDD